MTHLQEMTQLQEPQLHDGLNTLKRHEVVKETKQGWQIVVELFRRWVYESFRS